jgi:hypothetical protein
MLEESTPHRVNGLASHQPVTAPCGSYAYSPLLGWVRWPISLKICFKIAKWANRRRKLVLRPGFVS